MVDQAKADDLAVPVKPLLAAKAKAALVMAVLVVRAKADQVVLADREGPASTLSTS